MPSYSHCRWSRTGDIGKKPCHPCKSEIHRIAIVPEALSAYRDAFPYSSIKSRSGSVDFTQNTLASQASYAYTSFAELDLSRLQMTFLNSDDYVIVQVGWYQERTFWNHQYVLVMLRSRWTRSETLYVRVERNQSRWRSPWKGSLSQKISISRTEEALTTDALCVAECDVDFDFARQSATGNLEFLSSLVDLIQDYSLRFSFVAFDCWFAEWCYDSITEFVRPPNSPAPSVSKWKQSTIHETIAFGNEHYFRSHWPYWILTAYAIVGLTSLSPLTSTWPVLAYAVPVALSGAWAAYYALLLSTAWRLVQERLTGRRSDLEIVIGARLAWHAIGVSFLLVVYGLWFLLLAWSPRLIASCTLEVGA